MDKKLASESKGSINNRRVLFLPFDFWKMFTNGIL